MSQQVCNQTRISPAQWDALFASACSHLCRWRLLRLLGFQRPTYPPMPAVTMSSDARNTPITSNRLLVQSEGSTWH
jgi:hypothetical protein